eukprot:403340549
MIKFKLMRTPQTPLLSQILIRFYKSLPTDHQRIYDAEQAVYLWSKVLCVFAGIAICFSLICLILDYFLFKNYQEYLSYEMPGMPSIFKYAQSNTSVNIDINQKVVEKSLIAAVVLHLLVLFQGCVGFYTLHPISSQIDNDINERKKQVKNLLTDEQRFAKMSELLQEDNRRRSEINFYDKLRFMGSFLTKLSIVTMIILPVVQYIIYDEMSRVIYKWVDDSIEAQVFDTQSRSQEYIDAFKQTQSISVKRYGFIGMLWFNLMAIVIFYTMNAFVLYGSHQLQRKQKRTQEE